MERGESILTAPINRRQLLKGLLGLALISGAGIARGYANTREDSILLERVNLPLPRLPAAFRGMKIGQISDLHSSPLVAQGLIARAVSLVMGERPELIALTGDFIGDSLRLNSQYHPFNPDDLDRCAAELSRLQAPLGIFAVLGNHDFWSGPEAALAIHRRLNALGFHCLRNERISVKRADAALEILGVDDLWEESCNLPKALSGSNPDQVKILLSHNPEINDQIRPQDGIDLVLSGHTHGGQVVLPLIGPPFLPGVRSTRYIQGLVRDGNRLTYTTRGVGHLVAPVRFNCPPEVTVLTLA